MHYYGYKLHATCGIRGVIHSYDMTAASVHDLHYLNDARWEYHNCMMIGDKGYRIAHIQWNLFEEAKITLEVQSAEAEKPASLNHAKQSCGLFARWHVKSQQ